MSGASQNNPNVVAFRVRALGDVLASLAALRALHLFDSDRDITYVVDEVFHPLLAGQDYITRLLPTPPGVNGLKSLRDYVRYIRSLRRLKAEVTLDFHCSARTALTSLLSGAGKRVGFDVKVRKIAYNVVEPRARTAPHHSARMALFLARHAGVAADCAADLPAITPAPADIKRVRGKLARVGLPESADTGPPVGINPGKAYPSKAWPQSRFVELAQALAGRGRNVVVLWGPGERETAQKICEAAGAGVWVAPDVPLSGLPALLGLMSMVVTIDSGLKHVAVCAGVPTVTLFGATSPGEWHIAGPEHRYLWRGYSCSPCRRLDCPFGAPCMSDITTGEVLEQIAIVEEQGGRRCT
jgi:ADP-heptose:LPS heptosyltransferase